MKIPVIRPFEHAVPSLSIDTKLNDTTIRKGGVLTSELGEVEDTYGIYDSILSPTTTLVDELPQLQPVYLVQTIDVNKHRIMHLQRYKHVLRLVMLCTTICWAALTVVFALLILHQVATKDNNQHTSGSHPNYTLIFVLVMIAVSVVWFLSALLCVWRFRKYKRWLNSSNTKVEWVVAGKPPTYLSSDTTHIL